MTPNAPGWWWGRLCGREARPNEVFWSPDDEDLFIHYGGTRLPVTADCWTWHGPVMPPDSADEAFEAVDLIHRIRAAAGLEDASADTLVAMIAARFNEARP